MTDQEQMAPRTFPIAHIVDKEQEAQIENWFTYHSPTADQLPSYGAIRDAGQAFARVIATHTPKCADQTAAIRKVREAVMTANVAIACRGK